MGTRDTRRIFKGIVINPVAPDRVDFYAPAYLVIEGEKIVRITSDDPRWEFPDSKFRDLGEKIILPGFVDTHVHLSQFAIRGVGEGELLKWLNTYTYPEEARFADPAYAEKISTAFFDEIVANGTTTAAIYCSIHEPATDIAFAAARAKGIRAFIGKVMMDRNSPPALTEDTENSIQATVRLFEKWDHADGGRLRYVFTPRFAGSCSKSLMHRVGQIARDAGAIVQSHLAENVEEVRWIRDLFPDESSYAAVYDDAELLGARSIMAHCIHLSDEEINLLAKREVKIAFCPYSNRTLGSGIMPYRKLRDAGLMISLGTDIAGGPSLSMFEQMREAMRAAGMTASEALYLATLAGARALGLSNHIGNFATGKDADYIVVGVAPHRTAEEALSTLCSQGDKKSVAEVYVRGNLMYF